MRKIVKLFFIINMTIAIATRTRFCTVIKNVKLSLWVVPKFAPQFQYWWTSDILNTRGSAMAEELLDVLFSIETRVLGLSCGMICVILRLAVFIQYRSVTDTHTHTHRQTDGRRDTRRRHVLHLA